MYYDKLVTKRLIIHTCKISDIMKRFLVGYNLVKNSNFPKLFYTTKNQPLVRLPLNF